MIHQWIVYTHAAHRLVKESQGAGSGRLPPLKHSLSFLHLVHLLVFCAVRGKLDSGCIILNERQTGGGAGRYQQVLPGADSVGFTTTAHNLWCKMMFLGGFSKAESLTNTLLSVKHEPYTAPGFQEK